MDIPIVTFDGRKGFGLSYKKGKNKCLVIQQLGKKYEPGDIIDEDEERVAILGLSFTSDESIDVTIDVLIKLRDSKKVDVPT
jgi:hypothetical protein